MIFRRRLGRGARRNKVGLTLVFFFCGYWIHGFFAVRPTWPMSNSSPISVAIRFRIQIQGPPISIPIIYKKNNCIRQVASLFSSEL